MDLLRLLEDPDGYARRLASVMDRAGAAGHDAVDGTAGLALAAFARLFGPGSPAIATDCKPGCSWCCRMMVTATAAEVLALAAAIDALPPDGAAAIRTRVSAAVPAVTGLDQDARRRLARPCPLLEADGRCGVYEARPLACRGLESFDAGACRAAMEGREVEVPLSATHLKAEAAVAAALSAGLAARDRSATRYELVRALAIALTRPDARAAWLAGGDPFAPAAVAVS